MSGIPCVHTPVCILPTYSKRQSCSQKSSKVHVSALTVSVCDRHVWVSTKWPERSERLPQAHSVIAVSFHGQTLSALHHCISLHNSYCTAQLSFRLQYPDSPETKSRLQRLNCFKLISGYSAEKCFGIIFTVSSVFSVFVFSVFF